MEKIKLGDKVKDKITGYVGIAVARTEFINGCVQYSVAPKVGKDNKIVEDIGLDEQCLEIIPNKKKKIKKERVGGANNKAPSMRGY